MPVERKAPPMARTRRAKPASTDSAAASAASGEFTCPECGRSFSRAAALGAHRRRAHGVAGATSTKRTGPRRGPANRARSGSSRSTTTRRSSRLDGTVVNRDALLQALFPSGLPASESVIRAAKEWLDQAEQLAKMK
jgi:Zinc finger, C2H2 type